MPDLNRLIEDHISVFQKLKDMRGDLDACAGLIKTALQQGHKVLVCGNGGSAADSQHFAAELTGHYQKERAPLAALALTTDTSALTAIGNDYAFEDVFQRQVEALASPGDVLVAISTSGNSANVIKAVNKACGLGVRVVLLTGGDGGALSQIKAEGVHFLCVPHLLTSRIQEAHSFILHYFCESLDEVV